MDLPIVPSQNMLLTKLEERVLSAMAEACPDADVLRAQIQAATVIGRDFTGCGVYTKFELPKETTLLSGMRWRLEDMPKADGEHPDLPAGAGFILWITDGGISCLEGYTYDGDWPKDEERFVIRA